ncbi:restriction endonuclease [Sedimentibacter sp. B4]|uniref:restriction endonuclease n=1 Tax=Sedimentibacter sp. B4 TaxID=304766 RepID=UPI0002E49A0E|nr:restriction endonuclease [Sedimentibacter sp. B4]
MANLSRKNLMKIADYVINNYEGVRQQVDNYLFDSAAKIILNTNINISEDYFIDELCDISSSNFSNFIKTLQNLIVQYGANAKINLLYSPPAYMIYNTTFGINVIKGNAPKFIQMINYILDNDLKDGVFYEKFCCLFFKDIGINSFETKHSRDDGIDIIAEANVTFNGRLIKHIFYSNLMILAQVKFHKCKMDVSIIRHIIGDSLFYRFNNENIRFRPLQLIVINHNGFTSSAETFAAKYGVILLSSSSLINIIMNTEDINCLKSIDFLKKHYLKLSNNKEDDECQCVNKCECIIDTSF